MLARIDLRSTVILVSNIDCHGQLKEFEDDAIDILEKKLKAVSLKGTIQLVIIAENQRGVNEGDQNFPYKDQFKMIRSGTIEDAQRKINGWFGPQEHLRETGVRLFDSIEFLGRPGTDGDFVKNIFQVQHLIQLLRKDEHVAPFSDPGYISKTVYVNGQQETIWGKITILELLFREKEDGGAPRIILFGEKGSGKSTYLKYIGKKLAERELPFISGAMSSTELKYHTPLFIDGSKWITSTKDDIYSFILDEIKPVGKLDKEMLETWIGYGDLFLLIDQIEKVIDNSDKLGEIVKLLNQASSCPALLTCDSNYLNDLMRTPSFPPLHFQRVMLGSLTETNREAFVRAYFKDFPDSEDPIDFINRLDTLFDQRSQTQNPFLLSLLCRVNFPKDGFPKNRSMLFDELFKLVTKDRFKGKTEAVAQFGKMLSLLAFEMVKCQLESNAALGAKQAKEAFDQYNRENKTRYKLKTIEKYNENVNKIFLETTIKGDIECFRYISFKHYFTAKWINGLKPEDIKPWIDKLVDTAEEQEILVFLAGLNHERLKVLSETTEQDDWFLHRTALIARCIPEVNGGAKAARLVIEAISKRIFDFFLNQDFYDRDSWVDLQIEHINRAAACLLRIDAPYHGHPISKFIADNLNNSTKPEKKPRLEALLGLFGHHPPAQAITKKLLTLLKSKDEKERLTALNYIKNLGSSLKRDEGILSKLIAFLNAASPVCNKNTAEVENVLDIITKFGRGVAKWDELGDYFIREIETILKEIEGPDAGGGKINFEHGFFPKLLIAIRSTGICRDNSCLTQRLFSLLRNEQLGEGSIYVAMVLAETDISSNSKENTDVFLNAVKRASGSSNEIRNISRDILERALQNTQDLSLRNPLFKYYQSKRKTGSSEPSKEVIDQVKENFKTRLKKNDPNDPADPEKLLNYWNSLEMPLKVGALSDEEIIDQLFAWLKVSGVHLDYSGAAEEILSSDVFSASSEKLPDFMVDGLIRQYHWAPEPHKRIQAIRILLKQIDQINPAGIIQLFDFKRQGDEGLKASLKFLESVQALSFEYPFELLQSLGNLLTGTRASGVADNADLDRQIISTLLRVLYLVVNENPEFDEHPLIEIAYKIAYAVRSKEQFPLVHEILALDEIGFRFYIKTESGLDWKEINFETFKEKLTIIYIHSNH